LFVGVDENSLRQNQEKYLNNFVVFSFSLFLFKVA
jgi:hypothetical protein